MKCKYLALVLALLVDVKLRLVKLVRSLLFIRVKNVIDDHFISVSRVLQA